jgi:uncharacterized protein (DUF362 family)
MSKVAISRADKSIYDAVVKIVQDLGETVVSPGDRVLLKPNLVHTMPYGGNDMTSPAVVEAVARYCLDCGASKVIIGEGPGSYQPKSRLRECFTRPGITQIAEKLGIEWVLFDEHEYRTFRNVSAVTPKEFRITEYAFNCDKLINLPVLKTHYLTTVTLAMKNLKGCLKWEDKQKFHSPDIHRAIVELNKIVRPTFNIIDATTWKEGKQKLIIAGSDIVAVDAVGCALMGIDPLEVRTVTLGTLAGLGKGDLSQIDIVGEDLRHLKLKVRLPQEQLRQYFPLLEITGADKACSGCIFPLISGLLLIGERGIKLKQPLQICLGKNPEIPDNKRYLLVGDCTEGKDKRPDANRIAGCPSDREELYNRLSQIIRE